VLKAARIATDGPALLELLRKQTVDEARRSKAGPLIRELGNADFETREKAEKDLLALGAAAVPALSEAQKDSDPEIASRSKELLKRIGTATDSGVVLAALRLIASQKPERAAETLLAYLPSAPNEDVRQEVVASLAAVAMREGKRDETLVQALSDKNSLRRAAAAAALGERAAAGQESAAVRIYLPGLKIAVKGADYRDGKEERSWELSDVKFFDHFSESAFAKPK
jgi:HEAT repeat protein